LHDQGYAARFPDVAGFTPAALLLTRAISRPTPTRVTFDLGVKAVASDPPAGRRCVLLDVPDCETVLHNEEHLVVETSAADRYAPGTEVLAIPSHVCPTVALHRHAHVVADGRVKGTWEVAARDRVLEH
jgi:D-serine deaminase-like pyridoxal phosphate-dependent protein